MFPNRLHWQNSHSQITHYLLSIFHLCALCVCVCVSVCVCVFLCVVLRVSVSLALSVFYISFFFDVFVCLFFPIFVWLKNFFDFDLFVSFVSRKEKPGVHQESFIWFEFHVTGLPPVLAIDLASACHSWASHIVSPLVCSEFCCMVKCLTVLAFKPTSWLSDPKSPRLEDGVEVGTVEDPVHLLDAKFLTGLDLAAILSSQSPFCNLFDMAWEQLWELKG